MPADHRRPGQDAAAGPKVDRRDEPDDAPGVIHHDEGTAVLRPAQGVRAARVRRDRVRPVEEGADGVRRLACLRQRSRKSSVAQHPLETPCLVDDWKHGAAVLAQGLRTPDKRIARLNGEGRPHGRAHGRGEVGGLGSANERIEHDGTFIQRWDGLGRCAVILSGEWTASE